MELIHLFSGKKTKVTNKGFSASGVKLQNSIAVFQLNFSNNIKFCASISRPNTKFRNVSDNFLEMTKPTKNLNK